MGRHFSFQWRPSTILRRQFVAATAAFLLAPRPCPANVASVGVIVNAERAHIGTVAASEGSTIYEGDRLSTDTGGVLRIRGRSVTLQLDAQSSLVVSTMAGADGNILSDLTSGGLIFSTAAAGNIVVTANAVSISPAANVATVAKILVVDPREIRIHAQRGALQFSYREESEIIPEGAAYRVLLNPSEKDARMALAAAENEKRPMKRHKTFLLLAIGVPIGILIPVLIHILESPDRPGTSPSSQAKSP